MQRKTFYGFSAPSLVMMAALMAFPLIMSIWLGMNFMTFRNIQNPEFIWFRNFGEVLTDVQFWQSMRFTLIYMAVTIPIQLGLGFAIALLLDQVTRLRGLFMAAMLLPFIVVPVVGAMLFRSMFDPSGIITWFFRDILDQKFYFTEGSIKAVIIIHALWYITPFVVVVLFAGLQSLPSDQIEAAEVDGAKWYQSIRYVVIPHLRSLFLFISLMLIMDAYRVFDSVFILTGNNPIFKADTVQVYNFEVGLQVQRLGKANAMAVLTVIGVLIVLIPFLIITYRNQIAERE